MALSFWRPENGRDCQSGEPAHLRTLLPFCDDGRIEIDNNAAERPLQVVALAERIFFLQVPMGGGESAIYSLLGTRTGGSHGNRRGSVRCT